MFASRHPPRMGGSTLFGSPRGTESPMDFEYTDRPKTRGVWATGESGDPSTPPRKRPFGEMHPPPSPFPGPSSPAPMFAKTGVPNVPFVMNIPAPHTSHPPPWVPPDRDVDMADVSIASADTSMADATSPSKPQGSGKGRGEERDDEGERGGGKESDDVRTISVGGLRRLFKSRQRQRGRSQKALVRVRGEGMSVSDDEESDEDLHTPVQNMSNHYTLNLSGPATQADMPAVLTGYLQFAFNCSLAAVFFYLLVLAIFTVQRDVQHRLGEYSMDMVQEIAQCTLHYKQNLCGTAPVPAMLHQCGLWETCMNRDPSKVGTARVVAELVAEVINSFVEPISWKTLLFTILSLTTITAFVNSMPAFFRRPAATHPTHAPPPPHAYHVPPVVLATPHRGRLAHRSYQDGSRGGYQGGGWQDWHPEEELEMPSRRRKLESGGVQEIR